MERSWLWAVTKCARLKGSNVLWTKNRYFEAADDWMWTNEVVSCCWVFYAIVFRPVLRPYDQWLCHNTRYYGAEFYKVTDEKTKQIYFHLDHTHHSIALVSSKTLHWTFLLISDDREHATQERLLLLSPKRFANVLPPFCTCKPKITVKHHSVYKNDPNKKSLSDRIQSRPAGKSEQRLVAWRVKSQTCYLSLIKPNTFVLFLSNETRE